MDEMLDPVYYDFSLGYPSDDWFVIDDGSLSPFVVRDRDIGDALELVFSVFWSLAIDSLEKRDRYSVHNSFITKALMREISGSSRIYDYNMWVSIRCVDKRTIRKWNNFTNFDFAKIDMLNPSDEDIYRNLFVGGRKSFMNFLRRRNSVKSFYVPEELLRFDRIKKDVQSFL